MSVKLLPFKYDEIEMGKAFYVDGDPHFTRRAIGEWLGYSNPKQAIANILSRNPHIDQFSTVLKLRTVDEKHRQVRVYNPIGFQLIVFESAQPKAKQYKIAVAKLVWAYMKGELKLKEYQSSSDLGYRELAESMERSTTAFCQSAEGLAAAMERAAQMFSQSADRLAEVMERHTQALGSAFTSLPQSSPSLPQSSASLASAASPRKVVRKTSGSSNKITTLRAYRSGLIQKLLDSEDPYYSYKDICEIVRRKTGERFSTGTLSHFFRLRREGLA